MVSFPDIGGFMDKMGSEPVEKRVNFIMDKSNDKAAY